MAVDSKTGAQKEYKPLKVDAPKQPAEPEAAKAAEPTADATISDELKAKLEELRRVADFWMLR